MTATPDHRLTERVTELEMRFTEQERIVEELSTIVAEQWNSIDQLTKKLNALTTRFLDLEEQAAPDIPVTKPPHW